MMSHWITVCSHTSFSKSRNTSRCSATVYALQLLRRLHKGWTMTFKCTCIKRLRRQN